jgi:pyridoxamine 5'-phosphate oxidase
VSIASIRRDYSGDPLSETESDPDPFAQFTRWFEQVRALEADPTAFALATSTRDGRPSVRTVLLKGADAGGFVFFTNYESRKAHELDETGRAAMLFYWPSLVRQVRIDGLVERIDEAESDAYFATRPIESRWSVYASNQSEVIESRAALESRYHVAREMYGETIPRPSWWGGYRVIPSEFEFWQGRPSRLHDRLRYQREAGGWRRDRLAP